MCFFHHVFGINSKCESRIEVLDYIRDTLIILVLYHHAGAPLSSAVLQFHMPALFVLAGYTEYIISPKRTLGMYVKGRFERLIIPYFGFEIANLLIYTYKGYSGLNYLEAIQSIILCTNEYIGLYGRLWFLPAMFVSSVAAYIIRLFFSDRKRYMIAGAVFLLFALSYISSNFLSSRLPFALDISLLATAFYLIGYCCGPIIKKYMEAEKSLHDIMLFAGCFLLCVLSNLLADPVCRMHANLYKDFPFMIITALSGTTLVFIFVKNVIETINNCDFIRRLLMWFSINSLATFPVHLTIKILLKPILGSNNWLALFCCMFVLNIPIVNTITYYFPFMLGQMRKTKAERQASRL